MTHYLTITKARAQFSSLVANAKRKWNEYVITQNGLPAAVLISIDQYESLLETNEILSDPKLMGEIKEGEKDVREGRVYDWEEVKKELLRDVQTPNIRKGEKAA